MSALDPKTLDNTEKSKLVKFRLLRVFILILFFNRLIFFMNIPNLQSVSAVTCSFRVYEGLKLLEKSFVF